MLLVADLYEKRLIRLGATVCDPHAPPFCVRAAKTVLRKQCAALRRLHKLSTAPAVMHLT